uniref:Uncharacterized protein n=1 Tax=Arundo donax TaxID=35708 RepID=A0A0A9V7J0_ARUDO
MAILSMISGSPNTQTFTSNSQDQDKYKKLRIK